MTNNKFIRLTEQDLNMIVKESVEKVINEGMWNNIKSGWQGAKNAYGYSKRQGEINRNRDEEIRSQPYGYNNYNAWEKGYENAERQHMSNDISTILTYISRMNIPINNNFITRLTQSLQAIASNQAGR